MIAAAAVNFEETDK